MTRALRAAAARASRPTTLEQELLARWDDEDLFAQTLAARAARRAFVFFEGPPTANGRPGIHHVFARTIKDLFCRHRAMKGFRVARKAGWDTHGLPVEIEVEKQLGISGKQRHRGARRRGVQPALPRERVQVPGRVGAAERAHRLLARLRASVRHVLERLRRERVVGADDAVRQGAARIAGTRSCRTARAAARRCRATRWRRATRTSRIRASTSRSSSIDAATRRRRTRRAHPRVDDHAVDARVERRARRASRSRVRRAARRRAATTANAHPRRVARARRARRGLRRSRGRSCAAARARSSSARAIAGRSTGCRIPTGTNHESSSARSFVCADDGIGRRAHGAGVRRRRLRGRAAAQPRVPAAGERARRVSRRSMPLVGGHVREGCRPAASSRSSSGAACCGRRARIDALVSALLALRHAAALLRARRRGSCARRRSRTRCWRATRASTGIRRRSARAGSASGSRTTSTGRSRAIATGARRCRSGSATRTRTHVDVHRQLRRARGARRRAAAATTSIRTSRTSIATRGACRDGGCARHDASRARSDRHLVRLGLDAVRAVALSVRESRRWSRRSSRRTSSPRAWTRRADGSTRCSRSRRGSATRCRTTATTTAAPYRAVVVNDLVLDADGREDVEEPRQRRRPVGGDRAARRRRGAAVPRRVEQGVGAARFDESVIREQARALPAHAQERLQRHLRAVRELRLVAVGGGSARRRDRPVIDRWMLVAARDGRARRSTSAARAYDATAAARAIMEFVDDDVANWYVRLNRARFYDVDARGQPRRVRDAARGARRRVPAARAVRAVRERLDASRADGRRRCTSRRSSRRGCDAGRRDARARDGARSGRSRSSGARRARRRGSRCASRCRGWFASRRMSSAGGARAACCRCCGGAQREAGRVRDERRTRS